MPVYRLFLSVAFLTTWARPLPAHAASPDFGRDVLPILRRSCFECHGAKTQKAKLRLDVRTAALTHEGVIVPGDAAGSELYRRISLPAGDDEIMPATGKPLSKKETELIRRWIEAGAVWPENIKTNRHWAYEPPTRPALPQVENADWARNEVDRFILARLAEEGLSPSPEADRAVLLRRVYLDLTGLPPSPSELDAFLADDAQDAYEKVVERLLSSPQFGERWARPWLDLARYADSHGFQRDDLREIWAYRDWVIKALNADMPFDEFTIEQLAGDLLPQATKEQKIATGFHRCTMTNVEAGSEPEETRTNQVIDRVNTTATVWLGTTLECAQCHDHKFDPFSQKEYYQLFAFFNNTALEAQRTNPKAPGSIQFMGPSMRLSDEVVERKPVGNRAGSAKKRARKAGVESPGAKEPTTLIMQELYQPRLTRVFARGDYHQPAERVEPDVPAVFPPLETGSRDRLALAKWLVDRRHPLVARVTVNRWWAELFGHGIVETVEDFGVKGLPPTHPELLDWLAVEFMDNDWSMKHVLRTIVTSATYRQSSKVTPELLARDDQNLLYARGPRVRMDAEMIRDNALAIAGLLSKKQFGPPIRPYQPEGLWAKVGGAKVDYQVSPGEDQYRRGIYVVWKRGAPYPSFVNFDATARLACTTKRSRSNTPLQALTLLNDPVYVEAAKALVGRTLCGTPQADLKSRIGYMLRLCVCREPTATEARALARLYEAQLQAARADQSGAMALWADMPSVAGVPREELAAWYAVATALLNLDETITKG